MPFDKVLVANRGEIASRVLRACRESGLRTVAVCSEADRDSPYTRLADEVREIGPAKVTESYLNLDRILEAARATGAGAIHPGYGFFAENGPLVRKIEEAGLAFIGPSSATIALMGDKLAARRTAAEAGVPLLPGTEEVAGVEDARRLAAQIGFPLVLKPAGGGGGIGMAVVRDAAGLERAYSTASRLGQLTFGNPAVYLEALLPDARHVEVQLIADHHGHYVHLGERECSLQRRYQKLVEEAPSPAVDDPLRREISEAALRLARAIGYRNAGTVEFLLGPDRRFYFLEMNTRIQVEHPVTEMVTGIDLVREQIRVAAGRPLSFGQEDARPHGHAIECRIYAEDPGRNFMPSPGLVQAFRPPLGPGTRLDGNVEPGTRVSIHYDPLLGKVIVWDRDRAQATARMRRALGELLVEGVRTTRDLLSRIMESPEWQAGRLHTRLLEDELLPRFNAAPSGSVSAS
jgi:acetyl-CoA carboxylase, biotin carboxylase subunit